MFAIRRTLLSARSSPLLLRSRLLSSAVEAIPKISLVEHPYPINGIPLDTAAEHKELFAVVVFSGRQYKVAIDDVIVADKIDGVDIDQKINLDQVLLVGSRKATIIGKPLIEGAQVVATIEEISKDKKVTAFKMRRRKNSRTTKGFRRQVTVLRVTDIIFGENSMNANISDML